LNISCAQNKKIIFTDKTRALTAILHVLKLMHPLSKLIMNTFDHQQFINGKSQ